MIELTISILCSCTIFILFKLFPRLKVNTFQAVLSNYIVAFIFGILLFNKKSSILNTHESLLWLGFLCGLLFISLFTLMAISSQRNGVGTTSIAVKMSMALSVIGVSIIGFTPLSYIGILGLILAILGVFIVSYSKEKRSINPILWVLPVLFLGSGLLDFLLYVIQKFALGSFHPGLFSAIGFGFAAIIGILYFCILLILGKTTFDFKSWFYGFILGIPNFFSIYLIIVAYSSTGWVPTKVISIANVAVVSICALLGFLFFKENFTLKKTLGLVLCISAMILCFFYL